MLAITQMLGVGTTTLVSHAAGRKDQDRGDLPVQPVAGAVDGRGAWSSSRWRCCCVTSTPPRSGADAKACSVATEQYLLWFIPAMALQFAMVAMGAALRGTGNFKPGMIVQTGTVDHQHRAGAGPDLRLGSVPGDGRQRRGGRHVRRRSSSAWCGSRSTSSTANAYLRFHFADWKPQVPACGGRC